MMPILIVDDYLTVEVGSANGSEEGRSLGWVAQKIEGGPRKILRWLLLSKSLFFALRSVFSRVRLPQTPCCFC